MENCQKIFCVHHLNKHYTYQGLIQSEFHTSWSVWVPKNAPYKWKVNFLNESVWSWKTSFVKLLKISLLITPLTANVEKRFSVLTLLLTRLWNALPPKSLVKLMQLISLWPHTYDLDLGKISALYKFLNKLEGRVLTLFNFIIHI